MKATVRQSLAISSSARELNFRTADGALPTAEVLVPAGARVPTRLHGGAMVRWWALLTLLLVAGVRWSSASPCSARERRMSNACEAAGSRLTITTANGSWVRCDQQLDKQQFEELPNVAFPAALQDSLYSLIMVDPDVPGHGPGRFWLHWIVANIPGGDFASGIFNSADVIAEYQKPEPPAGSGAHRYVFLAYLQPGGRALLQSPSLRPQFRLLDFLRDSSPYCLQGPMAGAQFRAAY